MSTALSHLSGAPMGLLSGSDRSYSYADLLKEQFEPEPEEADLINEILAEVEKRLRGEVGPLNNGQDDGRKTQ